MVERILKFLDREWGGLQEAALLLALFTFLSQILGLLRDRLFAAQFGAGELLDIYYASFRIPDFIYASVASFVSVTVIIPFLLKHLEVSEESGEQFMKALHTVYVVVMVTVMGVIFFFIPLFSSLIAPGFSTESQGLLVNLTRLLLLSPFILGLSNLAGGVTQSFRRFFIYALSPILYNVGIIIGIIFFYPVFGLQGLGMGVILGAILHWAIQWPTLIRSGIRPGLTTKINWREIFDVIFLSLPRTVAISTHQFIMLVLVSMASAIGIGAISVFSFASNLQSVPMAIVGISYSVAAFPTLAKLISKGQREAFMEHLNTAIRHIIFWSLPASVLFIVLRAQIVRVVLGSGQFGWTETRLVAATLAMFVASLLAQNIILLFVRAYYAAGKTIVPFFANLSSAVLVVIMAIVLRNWFQTNDFFRFFLESLFRIDGLPGTEIIVLPLAFSIGVVVNVFILWTLFARDFGKIDRKVVKTFHDSFGSAIIAGFVSYLFLNILDNFLDKNTFWGIFGQGAIAGVLGIFAGIILLRALHNKELEEIRKSLHNKFWKTDVILPEPDQL